jgi:glycosyltransferase involved in cell wall biosynthesis
MHRPVNIDAALLLRNRIMPLVARECPGARLAVVGNNPPSRLRALSGRDFLVTGAVESIEPFLAKAAVFAAPLRVAGGVIVKILQAMAAGKPVVASRCANAGIGAEEEGEILLADRPEDFARRVIELLKDPGRAAALGQAARRFVRERFNPARARQRIDEIYASAARPAEDLGEGG